MYSMTEQQSYSTLPILPMLKSKATVLRLYFVIENEQSSEGTVDSRDLDIADLATVKSMLCRTY